MIIIKSRIYYLTNCPTSRFNSVSDKLSQSSENGSGMESSLSFWILSLT